MNREVVKTEDNSSTLFVPELNQHYHSMRGAVQESMHVFIEAGLNLLIGQRENINILEMGMGTGLNVLLTAHIASPAKQKVEYHSLEKFPLSIEEAQQLNYADELGNELSKESLLQIHQSDWNKPVNLNPVFILHKHNVDLRKFDTNIKYDLIYYDAFAPSAQPELWTEEIFSKLYSVMNSNGILVTYCVKGDVRRAMKAAGFEVEKIPGPAGKREMARAFKK